MAQKLVLSDKIYNINSKKKISSALSRYYEYLNDIILGFPDTKIKIKKLRDYDKRIEVTINGPEEVFVKNILKKEIGFVHQFDQIQEKNIYKGTIVDLGKVGFGIFVDCAIFNPQVDILITLHTLRKQLCNGKEKSLREIIKTYDLIENFPLFIHVISIDLKKKKIEGKIADKTIRFFKYLLNEKLDAVLITGETKAQLKKALIKTDHYRDIAEIERFGFLEDIILLKRGTNAPGIISDIGRYLKGCKLSAFRPDKISSLME